MSYSPFCGGALPPEVICNIARERNMPSSPFCGGVLPPDVICNIVRGRYPAVEGVLRSILPPPHPRNAATDNFYLQKSAIKFANQKKLRTFASAFPKKAEFFRILMLNKPLRKIRASRAKRELAIFSEAQPNLAQISKKFAEIAQLVEHDLAKVGVASSSLVFRSKQKAAESAFCFFPSRRLMASYSCVRALLQ